MKNGELFRDIFGLAVRLLGLVFLCLGLKDVPVLLDVPTLLNGDKLEILNSALPVLFNLAIAWWLIGGGLLIRRAYPAASAPLREREQAVVRTGGAEEASDPDSAEKRLASLVGKPRPQ